MTLDNFFLNEHHPRALRGLLSACLLLVAACPGKDGVLTDYFNTDGSTTDGSTATGPTTGGSATGTATTGPDLCEDPSVPLAEVGPEVTVTLRNAGAADIFVLGRGFCGGPAFTVHDAADEQVIIANVANCPPSCDEVLQFGQCGCNDIGCPPGVIRIAPGGVFVDTWSGVRFDFIQPPAACVPESCVGQSCAVRQQTEAGTYTLGALANSVFVCPIGECACELNAEGWCLLSEAELDPVTTVEAELVYPDDVAVELVFE